MNKIDEYLRRVHGSKSGKPQPHMFSMPEKVNAADIHAFCRATPGLYLILQPDLTIVDASDAYRRATLIWREEIRGCRLFDVFPDNPYDATVDGVQNLRASLHQVLQTGRPHRMVLQRYDVRDHVRGDEGWVEKFWLPVNLPVFGNGSRELTYLIHQVEDVTQAVFLRQSLAEQELILAEQRVALDQMWQELLCRQREVRAAQKSIGAMLQAPGPQEHSLEAIREYLGVLDPSWYWSPDHCAPVTGVYNVFHQRTCDLARSRIHMQAGQAFPECSQCKDGVLYRLLRLT